MKTIIIGINHKISGIDIREKFYLQQAERELLYAQLNTDPAVFSAMVLSTCNRCEIYANVLDEYEPILLINKLFSIKHLPGSQELYQLFYIKEGQDAVGHLLQVACGLDSLILGEKQILAQIKDAIALSRKLGMMDKTFNILGNLALETARKVRRETTIDAGGSSVSWACVCKAQEMLGSLQDKKVLILGSGKMGRLAVEQFMNKGGREIYIMNRTLENAQELSQQTGAKAVGFWEMPDILPEVDICICSSSCPHFLIEKELVESTMSKREHRRLIFIDISVPRNVDPSVSQIAGVSLLAIDDLRSVVQDSLQKRMGAVDAAVKIVDRKVYEFDEIMNKVRFIEHRSGS